MNLTIKLYYIGKYRKQNMQDQQGIHVRFRNTLPSQYKNTFSIFHECSSLAGANSYQFHSDFQLDQITIPNDLVLHRHLRYFLPIFYIIFLLLLCVCITLLQGYDVKKQIFNIYFTMFLYMTSNVLLMIPEMMRSQIYQCAEIEKTCKYNMVQILCYRLILFTTMLLVSVCMITFYTSRIYPLSFIRLFALMICNLQLTLLLTVCLYLMWKINDVKIMILYRMFITHFLFNIAKTHYFINIWNYFLLNHQFYLYMYFDKKTMEGD